MQEELGYADSVIVEEIASQRITVDIILHNHVHAFCPYLQVFRTAESRISTVVLRGATVLISQLSLGNNRPNINVKNRPTPWTNGSAQSTMV